MKKWMLGAVAPAVGSKKTRVIWTDAEGGRDDLDAISKALLDAGMQPEGLDALTATSIRKFREQDEAEAVVKAAGDRLIVFEGMRFGTLGLVRKDRHSLRDESTGKYAKTVEHDDGTITHSTPLGLVQHYNVHPALRAALTSNPRDAFRLPRGS